MKDSNVYASQVAIVTGGASGIGAALASELGGAGARVVVADRQVELAESVAAAIRTRGGEAIAMELDVRDFAAMQRVVEATVARWSGVHYFFNNAGIIVGGEADAYEAHDWDELFDVNIRGVAYGIQAVYPVMIRQGSGHIINTASIAGLLPTPGQVAYSTSKHAVVGLSRSLRIEAKRHGVRVSALCPGVIRTAILTGGKYGRTKVQGVSEAAMLKAWESLRPMDAGVFAKKVAAAVARNEAIIIVPSWWKIFWGLDRLSPLLGGGLIDALFTRMRAQLEAAGTTTAKAADVSVREATRSQLHWRSPSRHG
ncbi:MAG TPA: SDR family oxidoreductase [Polyangiales bacterium]|nr:SDR family oxidoreductase [Polyangiales bacterium]